MMAKYPINLKLRLEIFRKNFEKLKLISHDKLVLTWQDGSSDGSPAGAEEIRLLAQPGDC